MSEPINLQQLSVMCEILGLKLPDAELQRILPGVNRSRRQVEELRALLEAADEPAATFCALAPGNWTWIIPQLMFRRVS